MTELLFRLPFDASPVQPKEQEVYLMEFFHADSSNIDTKLLQACGLPADLAGEARGFFDTAVLLIQSNRLEINALATVAMAKAVVLNGGQSVHSLPVQYDGCMVEHKDWVQHEDLAQRMAQLGARLVGVPSHGVPARGLIDLALGYSWLQSVYSDGKMYIRPQKAGVSKILQATGKAAELATLYNAPSLGENQEAIAPATPDKEQISASQSVPDVPPSGQEAEKGNAAQQMTWQQAAKRLEQLRQQGEPYSSYAKLAGQIGCGTNTVKKAFDNTPTLQTWVNLAKTPTPKAQSLNAVVLGNTMQSMVPDPSDITEDGDIDAALRYLIENAQPNEKAAILAMSPEKQRDLASLAFNDPGRGNKILDRRP